MKGYKDNIMKNIYITLKNNEAPSESKLIVSHCILENSVYSAVKLILAEMVPHLNTQQITFYLSPVRIKRFCWIFSLFFLREKYTEKFS